MGNLARPGRCIFNGRDEVLAAGLLMGAGGGIGTFYNLLPELFVEIYDAAIAGRWDAARTAQGRVNTLIRITLDFPLFPAVKQMLVETSGTDHWIRAGKANGGMASSRSQLGADIHEIDNAASRCGRLLDEVAAIMGPTITPNAAEPTELEACT